jgi:Prokaryotic Cytochrome C oxidase subunit IV
MTTAPGTTRDTKAARRTTVAWAVLIVITVLSWWLAPGHSGDGPVVASIPITVVVVLLGLIKSRLIIQNFMEVRTAPRWLRLATDGWLIVLWGAVLGIYLL